MYGFVPPPMCKMCGKVKYTSEKEALRAVKFREKEYGPQWPYWTFECGCWHLTSTPPDKK